MTHLSPRCLRPLAPFCLALWGSVISGCAADAEPTDELGQKDEIKPNDKDKYLNGFLTVLAPKFSGLAAADYPDPSLYDVRLDGGPVTLGDENELREGGHEISLSIKLPEAGYPPHANPNRTYFARIPVQIVRKQKMTITLPLAAIRFAAVTPPSSPNIPAPDFGRIPPAFSFEPTLSWNGVLTPGDSPGPNWIALKEASTFVVPVGDVEYGWEISDSWAATADDEITKKTLVANDLLKINLGKPKTPVVPSMFTVKFEMPTRALPDAGKRENEILGQGYGCEEPPIGKPAVQTEIHVPMPLDQNPSGTTTLRVKRIDVHDVDVSPEVGIKNYFVKGKYKVVRESDGANLYTDVPTNTGLDLLPGKYFVSIAYQLSGEARTQEFHVDLK